MKTAGLRLAILAACAALTAAQSGAQTGASSPGARRAFLVGESAYTVLPPLKSPRANVEALEGVLKKAQFVTTPLFDLSQTQLVNAWEKFIGTVQPGDFVLFYFSGFGYRIRNVNYLLPVSFDPNAGTLAGERALSVPKLQELDERNPGTRMLLFDANRSCTEALKADPGKSCPDLSDGLGAMPLADDTVIAFSTGEFQTAPDPPGGGVDIFTAAVIHAIETPGSKPIQALTRARAEVRRQTASAQDPLVIPDVLVDNKPFFFTPPAVTSICVTSNALQRTPILAVTMAASGGAGGPYTFTATGLPAGLNIASDGTISGTPMVIGMFSYTVTATDKNGNAGTVNCTVTVEAPTGPTAGEHHEDPKDKLEYSWIPPGKFLMGCVPGDKCEKDEIPRHEVTISKGFWITRTEVTVNAYNRFTRETGHRKPDPTKTNYGLKGTELPITNIYWEDAADYCKWAGGRLPTEAEWEYAARGGKPDWIFPWGAWDATKANYGGTDVKKARAPFNEMVAARQIGDGNGYDLYDMAGNAAEWTADFYSSTAYTDSPAADPKGPPDGKERVVRGGSWNDPPKYLRNSARDKRAPDKHENTIGFRCVLPSLSQPK